MNEYCLNLVRDHDYNHYLLSFFVPRQSRADFIAILAFHVELSLIPTRTNEPSIIAIRTKWWHDEIEKIYAGQAVSHSPVLEGVRQAIQNHDIPKPLFYNLLENHISQSNIDEALYALLLKTTPNQNKLTKKITLNNRLPANTHLRAVRLLLGI